MDSLRSRFLETVKHAVVFGMGSLANKLLGLILLPLYTFYLSPSDYGVLSILAITASLVSILWTMGLTTSLFRHYGSGDREHTATTISSALYWLVVSGALVLVLFWFLAPALAAWLLDDPLGGIYFRIMGFTLLFSGIQTVPLVVFRAEKKSLHYALFSVASFITGASLSVYLVAGAHMGVLGTRVANLVTTGLFAVIGLVLCRHRLTVRFSWQMVRTLLRYGLPFVPARFGSFALSRADRYFLRAFTDLSLTGLYHLGSQFGMVINLLMVQPLQLVWLPTIFEMQHKPHARLFFQRMLTYYLVFSSWVALGLSLLSREVIALLATPAFYPAYKVVPWISFAYVAYGAYMVVNVGIYVCDRTRDAWKITLAGAALNLALNFVLVPSYDILGAALAALLSYVALFAFAWWLNRRIYPLQYEWDRIAKILAVTALVLFIGQVVPENVPLALLSKAVLLLGYWGLLYVVRFFQRAELSAALRTVQDLRHRTEYGLLARRAREDQSDP